MKKAITLLPTPKLLLKMNLFRKKGKGSVEWLFCVFVCSKGMSLFLVLKWHYLHPDVHQKHKITPMLTPHLFPVSNPTIFAMIPVKRRNPIILICLPSVSSPLDKTSPVKPPFPDNVLWAERQLKTLENITWTAIRFCSTSSSVISLPYRLLLVIISAWQRVTLCTFLMWLFRLLVVLLVCWQMGHIHGFAAL